MYNSGLSFISAICQQVSTMPAKSTEKSMSSKSNKPEAVETRQSIAEQTAAFLQKGGKITQIPNGVSGQTSTSGPKHITLGNSRR